MSAHPLVVFCHLRWDFVYQRPQHLLTRLAQHRPVHVIEEPIHTDGAPHWETLRPQPNITIHRPHTNHPHGFDDAQIPVLLGMLDTLQHEYQLTQPVAWLYTPLALPLAQALQPSLLVYDCMDELSAFDHAPPQLLLREAEVLAEADLVFTGGPSLYRAKRNRHPSVHCFPSSVDAAHFAVAQQPGPDHPAQAELPHPRLGFYGVIDERLDRDLVGALATAHPEWQIVMVGPVVKIDPAWLPKNANIHYLGQRSYAELPELLRGWDVCLLPFARNKSTEFISPTKTLEYMAAQKPIVSTPITDVAEPYGQIVGLGATHAEFIAACEQALNANASERTERFTAMRGVLAETSWNRTASAMNDLIEAALPAQPSTAAQPTAASQPAHPYGGPTTQPTTTV